MQASALKTPKTNLSTACIPLAALAQVTAILNRSFNQDSGARTFRFVNNSDIVSRIPPRTLNYSHVGKFLYFSANGKELEIDPHLWYKFLEDVKGVFEATDNMTPGNIADHSMEKIASAVTAAFEYTTTLKWRTDDG